MRSTFAFGALVCAAIATSVAAFPTPAEPLFVSRMVRRQVQHDNSDPVASTVAPTCGEYVLQEPQKLKVGSYNDSTTAFLTVSQPRPQDNPVLAVINPDKGEQPTREFDFQTCDYQGFTQGYSRNSGGSMGAPIEFWGRVVTNITVTDGDGQAKECLSASPSASDKTAGTFTLEPCNDADSKQWFRLQEGLGGSVVSYFPVKNTTDYVYNGQTPEYFKVDLHPETYKQRLVEYTSVNTQQYVFFD